MSDKMLTVREFSALAKLHPNTVYKMCSGPHPRLPCVRIGRGPHAPIRIPPSALNCAEEFKTEK